LTYLLDIIYIPAHTIGKEWVLTYLLDKIYIPAHVHIYSSTYHRKGVGIDILARHNIYSCTYCTIGKEGVLTYLLDIIYILAHTIGKESLFDILTRQNIHSCIYHRKGVGIDDLLDILVHFLTYNSQGAGIGIVTRYNIQR
jgi:hypothetical protein